MPELPEAETNRRRIERHCLNRTIEAARLGEDVTHLDLPDQAARDRLEGRQFTEARRHGKYIFAGSKSGPWIVVHLGMSGSLRPFDGDQVPDYARFILRFEGGTGLAFRCPRKFGWVALIDDPDDFIADKGLGPDALAMGDNAFAQVIGTTAGMLKPALMKQSKIAGIGNLWSDEALFQTGLHPEAKGTDLGADAVWRLHGAVGDILGAVCETEAEYDRLPRDWLIAHREAGADCRRCGGTIEKKTVGGRTAYFCPSHQG